LTSLLIELIEKFERKRLVVDRYLASVEMDEPVILRLRLGLQRSNEFQAKTVSTAVADDGHHSDGTRNSEFNLQQITRFQPDSGIQFHATFT